jgi:hypothetical protein
VVAEVDEDSTAEIVRLTADSKQGDKAGVKPSAVDVVHVNATYAEAPAVDGEEGHAAGVEPSAVEVEDGDAGEAGSAVVPEFKEDDTAELGPPAVAVEDRDTAGVEPRIVDVEEGDTGEAGPAMVAAVVQADTSARGPEHDDPGKMPGAAAVVSGDQLSRPQVPEQQAREPEPVQTPVKRRGFGYVAVAAIALAALLIGGLLFTANKDRGLTAQSLPTVTVMATGPTTGPSNGSTKTAGKEPTIQLVDFPETARSFKTVRVKGTYRGGPDTFVQAQRWEGGQWLDFPLPAKTDESGRFTTFIELGPTGRYRLRVVDPQSGVRSKTFVLVVMG